MWNTLEEISRCNCHPVAYAPGSQQCWCVIHDVRTIKQDTARSSMTGKHNGQHVACRAANVNDSFEHRKIICISDGRGFLGCGGQP